MFSCLRALVRRMIITLLILAALVYLTKNKTLQGAVDPDRLFAAYGCSEG